MTDAPETSTWSSYRRLLPFARPYRTRLAVAVVAGLFVGGSLFGLLRMSPELIRPFEAAPGEAGPAAQGSTAAGGGETPSAGEFTRVMRFAERLGVPVVRDDGGMTWQFMAIGLVGLPVLILLRAGTTYVNRYYMRWVGSRVVADVRQAVFDGLQGQSLKFFGKRDVGRLISRCVNDATVVEQVIASNISEMTRAPVEILAAAAFVASFMASSDLAGLVSLMLLAFPLCIVPIIVLGRRVKRHTAAALERISDLVSRMHENFTGVLVVKAFNMERHESERFAVMNGRYFRSVVRAMRAELLMPPLMEAVSVLLVSVFFVVCYARGVRLHEIIPIALAGVVLHRPIKQLARLNANLQKGGAALARIFDILDTHVAIEQAAAPVVLRSFRDRAVFEHVTFSYDPDADPVIDDVSIDIPRGSVVALVGETGSGKTTLAHLLVRFYDPTKGRILLDGTDLREVEIASLRRLVGVVTQDTILFNDTIASNIAYGTTDASMARVQAAAREANAHEFITAEPEGYERVVGEKGFLLSGGERQRLAIARAILKNPPILILDEATSALDTVTERLVQEAIARVMKDRTVFAIAHRLSTVKHADQILLVDGGRIVERGTHDELYRAGGRYRGLCDMQMLDG